MILLLNDCYNDITIIPQPYQRSFIMSKVKIHIHDSMFFNVAENILENLNEVTFYKDFYNWKVKNSSFFHDLSLSERF